MKTLNLLSGGAAQGLVGALQADFGAQHGLAVEGTFGAVGLMRDQLLGGAPCDVLILTQPLIDQLVADGHVVAGSDVALGIVKTGVAVKDGEPLPDVSTAAALKAALMAAQGIYFPDPAKATAGIHFMKVMQQLGVAQARAAQLRPFPNGNTAMRELSQAQGAGLIGCTQVTEILYTPGVRLAGLLPGEFELATRYTAAVCRHAGEPAAAAAFIRALAGAEAAALRASGGFEAA